MKDMFMEIHKNEKNEKTAFILMLGVLSEKLTEIINLLQDSNKIFAEIKENLQLVKKEKVELANEKFYMPLTNEDYD